ncbi:type II toxin-antitoxin system VapC family toxin [Oryzicola mucosus]|uniref:Ribonuclease VapC n=1 Tax=Oryzicola mucosus TaxID=2767425 RepID=A0A8J6PJ54_9HYPH|nr:type II toxin-antitoxin system VapC family toxin [Oryzicola mucosus]MBD0414501.1 type II toxin-antitoxin system VapC family toxin [Oryzicola mucosus]
MSVVLDCSVALNWVLPDEGSLLADTVLDRVSVQGAVVPLLFRLEVGNALLLAVRRNRITAELREEIFEKIGDLPLQQDTAGTEYVWTTCLDLAATHGLSLYDATYLELAQRRRLPLATLDARLAQAAERTGIALFGAVS